MTLSIWTVFDHPTDDPDCFVARLSLVDRDGPQVTNQVVRSPDLKGIRDEMMRRGLTRLHRFEQDLPHIVEVWL